MSKFSKILMETFSTIEDAVDPTMVDPNIDPATGMPVTPMQPTGPGQDADGLAADNEEINDPEKLKLIEIAKKLLYIHPDDVISDATMSTMLDALEDRVTNLNADEQLYALKIIARDSIELDTGLKSSDNGSVDR